MTNKISGSHCLILLLFLGLFVRVESKSYLVLIGINDYEHDSILPDLANCVSDCENFSTVLQEQYGYSSQNIRTIYDSDATRQGILDQLSGIRRLVSEDDSVILYFSGHGDYDGRVDIGYWFAHDSRGNATAISNSEIRDWCKSIRCRQVLVIADTCFGGSVAIRSRSFGSSRRARLALTGGGFEYVSDGGSPNGRNSIFNHYLVEALGEFAVQQDPVNVYDIYNHLVESVSSNSEQKPQVGIVSRSGHEGGHFYFLPNGVTLTPEVESIQYEVTSIASKNTLVGTWRVPRDEHIRFLIQGGDRMPPELRKLPLSKLQEMFGEDWDRRAKKHKVVISERDGEINIESYATKPDGTVGKQRRNELHNVSSDLRRITVISAAFGDKLTYTLEDEGDQMRFYRNTNTTSYMTYERIE